MIYLTKEQAVCYVLSILLLGESYGTELIQRLELEYPRYQLSDTVLYAALKFLEDERLSSGTGRKWKGAVVPDGCIR